MNILADENIDAAMIDWLRRTEHDVQWAAESLPSEMDLALLDCALQAGRILLTRDRDFGELVYREGRLTSGIVLIRIRAKNQWERLTVFQRFWPQIEVQAQNHFLVVSNHQVRVRPLGPVTQ